MSALFHPYLCGRNATECVIKMNKIFFKVISSNNPNAQEIINSNFSLDEVLEVKYQQKIPVAVEENGKQYTATAYSNRELLTLKAVHAKLFQMFITSSALINTQLI